MKVNKNKLSIFIIVLLLLLILVLYSVGNKKKYSSASLDDFAKCISDKGFVMYGANWCSHCKNEKEAFGDSFRLIKYVECPDNPSICVEKGIQGYPTWMAPGNIFLEGEQGIEKLSQASGCSTGIKI